MILLILTMILAHKVLLRKDHYFFVYSLILLFAIESLPSEIGKFFVREYSTPFKKFC